MKRVEFPNTRCKCGVAQRDITPPVGIYHRMWGAATHDRATGVHRPLMATALVLAPLDDTAGIPQAIVAIDHCLMWADDGEWLRQTVAEQSGFRPEQIQIAFSHTHGAGLIGRERAHLPGGELIEPYLIELARRMADTIADAKERLVPAWLVYGAGRCNLATQRDYWDEMRGQYVCGFNPERAADDTLLVAQITDDGSRVLGTVVNYACHPTTLAWENTLISPDYIGAMREVVETATRAPCLFLQGASGELGPREGFVGDVSVADSHGRQLGYAVLAVLEDLPPAGSVYSYQQAVVSGAILGTWAYEEAVVSTTAQFVHWRTTRFNVELKYRSDLPSLEHTDAEIARLKASAPAEAPDNGHSARDHHARLEQLTRQRRRLALLPAGKKYPLPVTLWKLGTAIWLFVESEHYNYLQTELRRRFPDVSILVITVANFWRAAYLPTADVYGKEIYQEQIAVLALGCLEELVDSIACKISELVDPSLQQNQSRSLRA